MAENSVNDELTWNDFTVPELKEELTKRGLETTGRKADLVTRLEQYDKDNGVTQQKPEDENGEEFVVWNADEETEQDADFGNDYTKKEDANDVSEDPNDVSASVSATGDIDNKTIIDKQPKVPDPEFTTTTSKDKDLLYLMFSGQKITIPFKDEVLRDLKHLSKQQNIVIYPVQISDIYSDTIRPLIETAINVSTELDEATPGNPIKGYLRLKFGTLAEALRAMEILKQYKREGLELTLKNFGDDDSEGHILSKIKKEDTERRGPLISRLVYVGNLPSDVTEEALQSCFTDAVRVILPKQEESSEKLCYAYLEYSSESDASEAAKKYREVELAGHKLYVIKSMTVRAETFGLLKDGLRKYWLDQIRSLEASKAKAGSKLSAREIEAMDAKLLRMKRRIKNDNDRREMLALPVAESEIMDVPDGEEEQPKVDSTKPSERVHSSHGDSRTSERRRSPPRRRFSPPPFRGRGGSRGFRGGPSGGFDRDGGGADRLVDQLQELVGVLAHRERSSEFSGGYRGRGSFYDGPPRGGRGGYRGDYRGGYSDRDGGRYSSKRPGDEYGGDRKRHESDSYYRGGRGSFGSHGGSRRSGFF